MNSTTAPQPVRPIDIACPVCQAPAGEQCKSGTGQRARKFHSGRQREAELGLSPQPSDEPELAGDVPPSSPDYPVGSEVAPGIVVVEDDEPAPLTTEERAQADAERKARRAKNAPAAVADRLADALTGGKQKARTASNKARTGKAAPQNKVQEAAPEPAPATTEVPAPEGDFGTVKDAYAKTRQAVRSADGSTVSIYQPNRNKWVVTRDARVAASFKVNG